MDKCILLFVSICLILRLKFQALKRVSVSFPGFNSQFSGQEEMKQFSEHIECMIDLKEPQILDLYSHWKVECNFFSSPTCLIMNLSDFCSWVVRRLFCRFCLGLRTLVLGALSCVVRISTTLERPQVGKPKSQDEGSGGWKRCGQEDREPHSPRRVSAGDAPADATWPSWALPANSWPTKSWTLTKSVLSR